MNCKTCYYIMISISADQKNGSIPCVYLASSIFQIIWSCLSELNEGTFRLCEYQVILLPFLVTGICCFMKLDIWKWLILDLGNFWMPHLHKRICIQWRGRLDHVRGTLFFHISLWARICNYGMLYLIMVILLQVAWSARVFVLLNEKVGSG